MKHLFGSLIFISIFFFVGLAPAIAQNTSSGQAVLSLSAGQFAVLDLTVENSLNPRTSSIRASVSITCISSGDTAERRVSLKRRGRPIFASSTFEGVVMFECPHPVYAYIRITQSHFPRGRRIVFRNKGKIIDLFGEEYEIEFD